MTLFALGDLRTPGPAERAGEIARGDYWLILREGDDYILCYLSRELLGREKRLNVREDEARAILAGQLPVEQLIPQGEDADQSWSMATRSVKQNSSPPTPVQRSRAVNPRLP